MLLTEYTIIFGLKTQQIVEFNVPLNT